ncbi:hypothetical protein ABE501_18480 [Comamonas testosteroni]
MIKQHQIYTLPSGAIVKVCSRVVGTADDWNCVFQKRAGYMVFFAGEFIRKYGKAMA